MAESKVISLNLLSNVTTRTEVKNLAAVRVIELDDKSLTLQLPRASCARGHTLMVELLFHAQDTLGEVPFSATGTVTSLEPSESGLERVSLKLLQFERKEWELCRRAIAARQLATTGLLRSLRGESDEDGRPASPDPSILRRFLERQKVLVADPSQDSRLSVQRILTALGAADASVFSAGSFQEAQKSIAAHRPGLIIAEYWLGGSYGLDLRRAQLEADREAASSMFVLLAESAAQAAIARAAEEEVDAFVLKPVTSDGLGSALLEAAGEKLQPSEYATSIAMGKAALGAGQCDEAAEWFQRASRQHPKPALALYYLGMTSLARGAAEAAELCFRQGLALNKIHSKCLLGLYEAKNRQGQHEEAYDVLNRYSRYFPMSGGLLEAILRLAIMNRHYEDFERYYGLFEGIDPKSETLVKYICAALVVCAKHYLATTNRMRALDLLKRAALVAGGERPAVWNEIIRALIEAKMAREAREYYENVPASCKSTAEYVALGHDLLDLTT